MPKSPKYAAGNLRTHNNVSLISNWAYSLWYIDLIQDKSYNVPPVLNDPDNKSYLNLINDSDGQSIVVKSSQTNINTFQKNILNTIQL